MRGQLCKLCIGNKCYALCNAFDLSLCMFIQASSSFTLVSDACLDPFSSVRYNVTCCQAVLDDTQQPLEIAVSTPIIINIMDDNILEGVEYFQVCIVKTADSSRVKIGGQDTVNVAISDCECVFV